MLNVVALCGKIMKIYQDEDGVYCMTLAVERDFREIDGAIVEDNLTCTMWKGMAASIKEYYNPGQFITLQGRLELRKDKMIVIGEKIAFAKRYEKYHTKNDKEW